MAARQTLDEKLAALHAIRDDPSSDEALGLIRKALSGKTNLLAAKASQIVGEHLITEFTEDLCKAFDRFMITPEKTDKGCNAKTAIVDALFKLAHDDDSVYLRGIRHVQMEPIWGGSADTAAELRGASALCLVRMNYPDVMNELVRLLADDEMPARVAAARAMAYSGLPAAEPVLRFKVLSDDTEPQVILECMLALLRLSPSSSLSFVSEYLNHKDEALIEAAAMAIGESRIDGALETLRRWLPNASKTSRKTGFLAISMLRTTEAMDDLVGRVTNDEVGIACDAVEALAIHRYDERIRSRVEQVIQYRADPELDSLFFTVFSP